MSPYGLVWLRRDLRLQANPAIHACLDSGLRPLLVYVLEDGSRKGSALKVALHYTLASLIAEANELGWPLVIYAQDPLQRLTQLVKSHRISQVFWSKRYTRSEKSLDERIKKSLETEQSLKVTELPGWLLYEPDRIYKVFTPYYRYLRQKPAPLSSHYELNIYPKDMSLELGLSLKELGLLPSIPWHLGFLSRFNFSRAAVLSDFDQWIQEDGLRLYSKNRDLLALESGTSKISWALRLGVVGVSEIFHRVETKEHGEPFLRQLIWRDFAWQLLYHFPYTEKEPLDTRFAKWPWSDDSESLLAWQKGQTGFPVIDAAMQELWQTGFMHNRARMLVASFLVKNLNLSWSLGEAWFFDTLIDADEGNNIMGWQWVAGCGADAAPYFRIFNPCLQAEKFDADATYIRRYLPHLNQTPTKALLLPEEHRIPNHPAPIVSLKKSREESLARYKNLREEANGTGSVHL